MRVWERIIYISLGAAAGALLVGALIYALIASSARADAHDRNRPELDQWYRSLQSGKGPCCGGPSDDATSLEGPQWRTRDRSYEVFVEGEWIAVPEGSVVQVPNVDGRALVWLSYSDGHPVVRCFMPGTLS